MKEIIKKIDKDKMLLKIDSRLYEKDALLQASYKFTNKCYLNIELVDTYFEVYFESKNDTENLEKIALDFGNEIIDQQIRLQNGREFKEVREQLVKKAFSSINK
jgi:His-Xaa-Ser system protein HxsD